MVDKEKQTQWSQPQTMSNETRNTVEKWMVWYEDDTVAPVGVLAADRETAELIGSEARPDHQPTAVVGEDEGADIPADIKLSTLPNPKRYLSMVLNEDTQSQSSNEATPTESDECYLESDTTVADLFDEGGYR